MTNTSELRFFATLPEVQRVIAELTTKGVRLYKAERRDPLIDLAEAQLEDVLGAIPKYLARQPALTYTKSEFQAVCAHGLVVISLEPEAVYDAKGSTVAHALHVRVAHNASAFEENAGTIETRAVYKLAMAAFRRVLSKDRLAVVSRIRPGSHGVSVAITSGVSALLTKVGTDAALQGPDGPTILFIRKE
jgi:hypothetical protein